MDEFQFLLTESQEEILRGGITFDDALSPSDSERLLDSLVISTEVDQKPHLGLHIENLSSTGKLPSVDSFKGQFDFELDLNTSSKSYIYSSELNKVFVGIGIKFPVNFKWTHGAAGLFVRALPTFVAQEYVQDTVERCQHHADSKNPSNENFDFLEHVMRAESDLAVYHTDSVSQRHSVVVPLESPQAGADSFPVMYKFVCKNSCPSGMNRRATRVIFTLEDFFGEVLGRQTIYSRVCSCPKRDKDKEESDVRKVTDQSVNPSLKGKRAISTPFKESSLSKKIKLEDCYKVNCPDKETYIKLMQYAHGVMTSKIHFEGREPTTREHSFVKEYEKYL